MKLNDFLKRACLLLVLACLTFTAMVLASMVPQNVATGPNKFAGPNTFAQGTGSGLGTIFANVYPNSSGGTGVAFGATTFYLPIGTTVDCSFITTAHCYSSGESETNFFQMPTTCTAYNLRLVTGTSGGSATVTVTLRQNGVDTALTIGAINNTNATDSTHTVALSAGDAMNIEVTGSASSASVKSVEWACH